MSLHNFGFKNAEITQYFSASAQTTDGYGDKTLDSPVAVSHRVWLEEVSNESRGIGGDSQRQVARLVGPFLAGPIEGDFLTIAPDQVGSEESSTTRTWRIENFNKYYSSERLNSRIRRMELDLIEEV